MTLHCTVRVEHIITNMDIRYLAHQKVGKGRDFVRKHYGFNIDILITWCHMTGGKNPEVTVTKQIFK